MNSVINLFRNDYDNPRANAQCNLSGRTHYADDGTLRYHSARILHAEATADRLLFAIVESVAGADKGRAYQFVIFDLFGTVLASTGEQPLPTKKAAINALRDVLATTDAKKVTLDAIKRETYWHAQEMKRLRLTVKGL